jgi:putative serine/threonine protein kinase
MQLTSLKYLAKGKRSKVYTATYKRRKVIVKYTKRSKIEAKWLKFLKKLDFTPNLIASDTSKIIYFFIDGERILDYLSRIQNPKLILKQILKQCYELDKLKINKLELTNPYKHILVKNRKSKMIDFERCYKTNSPKNVTQFSQYIMSGKIMGLFRNKKISFDKLKFRNSVKHYKYSKSLSDFNKILSFL